MRIEMVPVDSLTLNPHNVNTHTDEQIQQLAASLEEFGQQSPLVIRHDGVVLRGNGLLKAARFSGMTSIAIVRSELLGSRAAGYAVADNRLGEKSQRGDVESSSASWRGWRTMCGSRLWASDMTRSTRCSTKFRSCFGRTTLRRCQA